MQRHLNLSRLANGVLYDAQPARAVKEGSGRRCSACALSGGRSGSIGVIVDRIWRVVVILILRNIISRDIEAACIRDVVNIKGVVQTIALADLEVLGERHVGAFLEGLAKNVALASGKGGFIGIAIGHTVCPLCNQRNGEAGRVKGASLILATRIVEGSRCSSERLLCGTARREWNDRVSNAVKGAVVEAADSARIIDDAVGLAALNDRYAGKRPVIDYLTCKRALLEEFGKVEAVGEIENMLAVEVR